MALPIQRRLTINQGASWSQAFVARDETGALLDLSSYSLRMQIRAEPIVRRRYNWLGDYASPTMTVTDAPTGAFRASLTADQTEDLSFETAKYDIEAVSGSTVYRLFEGDVTLKLEVTR